MALSAFADKSRQPQEAELVQVLGDSFAAWSALRAHFPQLTGVWGYTAASTGWGLRLVEKERVILYMTPCAGHFLASFALGERAVQAAREADLPAAVMDVVESARRYAEGRGVRLVVTREEDLPGIVRLATIKMAS